MDEIKQDKKHQSGKRVQILIVQVRRNRDGTVKELITLKDHFNKNNEYYSLLNSSYGSPAKALHKTIEWYLDSKQLAHPVKSLYEINRIFLDRKIVRSEDIANMGLYSEFENIVKGLKVLLHINKKNESEINAGPRI